MLKSQPNSTTVKAPAITTTNYEVNVSLNIKRQNDEISLNLDERETSGNKNRRTRMLNCK